MDIDMTFNYFPGKKKNTLCFLETLSPNFVLCLLQMILSLVILSERLSLQLNMEFIQSEYTKDLQAATL